MTRRAAKRIPLGYGKGSLEWLEPTQQWAWHGWLVVDGIRVRKHIALGTNMVPVARGKAEQIRVGERPAEPVAAKAVETFAEATQRIVATQRLKHRDERLRRVGKWAFPHLGHLRVDTISPSHLDEVLEAMVAAGKSRSTIKHVLDDCSTVLKRLWRDGVLKENPRAKVELPSDAKVDRRPRTVPTDHELAKVVSCARVDKELRVAIVFGRDGGGQRTSDLLAGRWEYVDTLQWLTARIHRPKTDSWSTLALPQHVARALESWWHDLGCPPDGPIFPVRSGKREGEAKARGNTWSKRLRRAFQLAGVKRTLPDGRCALQVDTATSRRADFHSLRRRAVIQGHAAGVPVGSMMDLMGHTDMPTHMGYRRSSEVLEAPAGALANFDVESLTGGYTTSIQAKESLTTTVREVINSDPNVVMTRNSGVMMRLTQDSQRSPEPKVRRFESCRARDQIQAITTGYDPSPAVINTAETSEQSSETVNGELIGLTLALRAIDRGGQAACLAPLSRALSRTRGAS